MNKYNSSDFFKMAGIKASIDIETYERDMKEKDKELERYKNIIDELEKYAEEEIIEGNKRPEDYVRFGIEDYVKGQIVAFKHILNKLKELKGSDSNE